MIKTTKLPRLRVWVDRDCGCVRATAPSGWAIDAGSLHEYVYDYLSGMTQREALAEARRERDQTTLVPCDLPGCDWCADARRPPLTGADLEAAMIVHLARNLRDPS